MKTSEPVSETQTITMKYFLIFGFMLGCVAFVVRYVAWCLMWQLFNRGVGWWIISFVPLIFPETIVSSSLANATFLRFSVLGSLLLGYFIATIVISLESTKK